MDSDNSKPKLNFIFFYGKGAAGKDTEGLKLQAEIPNTSVISTGDEIKRAQNPEHRFHHLIAPYEHYIEQGRNLPMEVVINLEDPQTSIFPAFVTSQLREGATTIISTGFPRTREQLRALDDYLDIMSVQYDIDQRHLWLEVSDNTARERTAKRFAEDRAAGKEPRKDDYPEKVELRLNTFRQDTLPLIVSLHEERRIIHVPAEGSKEQVHEIVELYLGLNPALEIPMEVPRPNPERF